MLSHLPQKVIGNLFYIFATCLKIISIQQYDSPGKIYISNFEKSKLFPWPKVAVELKLNCHPQLRITPLNFGMEYFYIHTINRAGRTVVNSVTFRRIVNWILFNSLVLNCEIKHRRKNLPVFPYAVPR